MRERGEKVILFGTNLGEQRSFACFFPSPFKGEGKGEGVIFCTATNCAFVVLPDTAMNRRATVPTSHKWGFSAGFIRRRYVARAFMPVSKSAICSRGQYKCNGRRMAISPSSYPSPQKRHGKLLSSSPFSLACCLYPRGWNFLCTSRNRSLVRWVYSCVVAIST